MICLFCFDTLVYSINAVSAEPYIGSLIGRLELELLICTWFLHSPPAVELYHNQSNVNPAHCCVKRRVQPDDCLPLSWSIAQPTVCSVLALVKS